MIRVLIFGQALQQLVNDSEIQIELEQDEPVTVLALFEANSELLNPLLPLMKRGEVLMTLNKKVGALHSLVRDGDTIKLTHNVTHAYDGAMWQNP